MNISRRRNLVLLTVALVYTSFVSCRLSWSQEKANTGSNVGTEARPNATLVTRWSSEVNLDSPLPEYPRPQMIRDNWVSLNGRWDYAITPVKEDRPRNGQKRLLCHSPLKAGFLRCEGL